MKLLLSALESMDIRRPKMGLGPNRFVAQMAARLCRPGRLRLVATEEQANFLDQLPVDFLPLEVGQIDQLRVMGLERIGQLHGIGNVEIKALLGPDTDLALRLAEGQDPRPWRFWLPPFRTRVHRCLEPPVDDIGPLIFSLKSLCHSLGAELAANASQPHKLRLELIGDWGSVHFDKVVQVQPAGAHEIFTLTCCWLNRLHPAGRVEMISLEAWTQPALGMQLALDATRPSEPETALIAEQLASIWGQERVLSPRRTTSLSPIAHRRFSWKHS